MRFPSWSTAQLVLLLRLTLLSVSNYDAWAWVSSTRETGRYHHVVLERQRQLPLQSTKMTKEPARTVGDCLMITHDSSTRRHLVCSSVAAFITFGAATMTVTSPSNAAAPTTPGEAIRRSPIASLPGLGPSDVFYPLSWQGVWKVRREEQELAGETSKVLEYTMRFLPSVQDDAVVADRGYNEAKYRQARFGDGVSIQSVAWTETNPNDLQIILQSTPNNVPTTTNINVKVTKRAAERTDMTVSSSEFQRIITDTNGGIPVLEAKRILTKWKMNEDGSIDGLELVYNVGGAGGGGSAGIDPMSYTASQPKPELLSKSRLHLERQ